MRHAQKRFRPTSGPLIALLALAGLLFAPTLAAETDVDAENQLRAEKTFWQTRYRNLLTEQARLRAVIEEERELYADANRRNYRRGKKRHRHRNAMKAAEEQLVDIEAQLATIEDDARRAGALPGWFYQVEWELEDEARRPSISSGPDDGGRNPLYLDGDDDG